MEGSVRSYKKSAGCAYSDDRLKPTDKVIGFPEPGYLVTQGIRLGQNSTLVFFKFIIFLSDKFISSSPSIKL